jgi:hypothetical protein
MKTEIPIGQTGEIDGIPVKAVAPTNYIWLCHGCYFVDMEEIGACKTQKAICRQPDRIFKRIETTN